MKNKTTSSLRPHHKILSGLLLLSLFLIILFTSGKPTKKTSGTFQPDKLVNYFTSTLEAVHLNNPDLTYYQETITEAEIPKYRTILWAAWKKANADRLAIWPKVKEGKMHDSLLWQLPTGKKALFEVNKKGKRPTEGYPMYINLHGGGTMPEAKTIWGAAFNNSEWKAAKNLGTKYADAPSLYFIPRMADDRRGRWYHKGEQTEFIRAWQLGVLSGDINPNKAYLIGISEGGYGSFRMGPFFADYFAGVGPMAGVSYLTEAPLENMRNTPFYITVGEFDAAYGRAPSAHQWKHALDSASTTNPGQFVHQVVIEKGKGHGVDYYKTAPWLRQFTRNPYPDTISFQYYAVHDTVFDKKYDTSFTYRKGFGYIRLDGLSASSKKLPNGLLQTGVRAFYVSKNGNTYHIQSENRIGTTSGFIELYIDKVNFSQPVTVYYNGQNVYHQKMVPNVGVMAESLALFGDPDRIFSSKVKIKIPNNL